jgi:hypothetical protein
MSTPVPKDAVVYRDRSFGLVIFGVIEILIGGFCGLLVPLGALAWWITGGQTSGSGALRSTVPVLVLYAVFAGVLIWLGVGSIRARRWACELMLSISRIWLLTGVASLVITWFILPGLMRSVGGAAGMPAAVLLMTTAVTFVIVSFVYVMLPGAFVLFYRSPDVMATCRARDPRPQFTDGCPPRILTLAVVWALAAVSVLVMPAYDWAFPFFGTMVVGIEGAVPWLVVLVVCGMLAWGSCRRSPWAWWGGVAATGAAAVSTVLTSLRMDPKSILSVMRLADDQVRLLSSISWPDRWMIVLLWVAVWGSMLAYLVSLRRFFTVEIPRNNA